MKMLNEQKNNFRYASSEPEISFLLHEKGRRLGIPVSGTFELCSRCNFNCKMCYIHRMGDTAENELTAEQWLKLGEKARDAGTVFLLLTGGEPLIRSDFKQIYSGLKSFGLVVSINTNGFLLSGEMTEFFIKNSPYKLNISLYGSNDDIYQKLCGVPAYSVVIDNIKKLKAHGIQVKLNISITPENCGQIKEIYSIVKELGINAKATTYMYPPIRTAGGKTGENSGRLSAAEAAQYRVEWDELRYGKKQFISRIDAMEKGLAVYENECIEPSEDADRMRCRAGSSSFWINYRGEMSACGVMTNQVFNTMELGFDEAWKKVRESTACIRLPKECTVCKYRNFCNVCAAVCYSESGKTDKVPDYVCELSRLTAVYSSKRKTELLNGDDLQNED